MTKNLVAALDQGTTGTRCIVFDQHGTQIVASYLEHRQYYPRPGWVEHDAAEIWANARQVLADCLSGRAAAVEDVAALGITNQRETTVLWDKRSGEPIANAIVWQDTRTQSMCQDLIRRGEERMIREKTGLPVATYFSATKIKWLLQHVSGARELAAQGKVVFGNIDTWLIWWLTGGPDGGIHVTDVTNASRTMLLNLETCDWDHELLALFDIPEAMLPPIRGSSEVYGETKCREVLAAAIPVAGDLGDQQAALLGQAAIRDGDVKNTYGTGCFMLMNTGPRPVASHNGLLTTVGFALGADARCYALEGSIAVAGAAIQWLRDNLGLIASAGETAAIAASVEDSGGVFFVPAFAGLFAPYWDMRARGAILGLTGYTGRAHIVRATLEAICYQTRDVLEAMQADAGIALHSLKVDGGAARNDVLMQLQADILGVPVLRPVVYETTALGAAYAAGLAVGLWPSAENLARNWQLDRMFEPVWDDARREQAYAGWQRAVSKAQAWLPEEAVS